MINKLRIGFIFENSRSQGGLFVAEISTAKRLQDLSNEKLEFKFYTSNKENIKHIQSYGLEVKYIKANQPNFFTLNLYKSIRNKYIKIFFNFLFKYDFFEKSFLKDQIDLVHFSYMSPLALLLNKINYGVTYWDCGHIEHPEFPESTLNYLNFENREYLYNLLLRKSSYIITDCEENVKNIDRYYRVCKDKIFKIYSEPSSGIINKKDSLKYSEKSIKENFNITCDKFIFYPAQFWPHKNHTYILEAIDIIKKKYNKEIDIVFSGNDKFNNLKKILADAKRLNVFNNLKITGFIDDENLLCLYKYAYAIVAPTYFGPTNHLPVEAFYLGTPIFYPSIHSSNEQVSGAVKDIDINLPEDLAIKLNKMIENEDVRKDMIKKGYAKYEMLSKKFEENFHTFKKIFDRFIIKKKNWK